MIIEKPWFQLSSNAACFILCTELPKYNLNSKGKKLLQIALICILRTLRSSARTCRIYTCETHIYLSSAIHKNLDTFFLEPIFPSMLEGLLPVYITTTTLDINLFSTYIK